MRADDRTWAPTPQRGPRRAILGAARASGSVTAEPMKRSPLAPILALALVASSLAGCKRGAAAERARIDKLEQQVKGLEGAVPDQATVMTLEAYHYTNLWFAVDAENWPLAGFYLNEARKNLSWAVRIVPVRKDQNGADVNIPPRSPEESLQKGQLAELQEAINVKDKERAP